MKKALPPIFIVLLLLVGLGLLFYPDISTWYNSQLQHGLVQEFDEEVGRMYQEAIDYQLQRAREYNEALNGVSIEDPFVAGSGAVLPPAHYLETLNVRGIMARIRIPRLDIDLPVFHTTTMAVLERGVGHIEGTSFPVGGQGTHAVLTGHSGLAHATMFTPLLDSHGGIEYGDLFFIQVLNQTLAYQVDQILTVLPHEIEALRISQSADYVTLVTCTPFALNTHRLLVRGARVPYTPEMEEEIVPLVINQTDWRMIIMIAFVPLFLFILLIFKVKETSKEERDILRMIERRRRRI